MKKISLIFGILLCGVYFSGCSWISELVDESKKTTEQEQKDCANFESANLAKLQNKMDTYKYYKRQINIIDETKGKLTNSRSKEFYCNVLESTKSYPPETKSFAVNGSGANDFSVKVTKNAHITQKVKEGEVIEKDIKITSYTPEKVSIVEFEKYIYKPDSLYIKKMRNQYARQEKIFRNKLPCFEMNRKSYCDGDLLKIYGVDIMLRVVEAGYGTVNYKLFIYTGSEPIAEAGYNFMRQFQMSPPEVIGNHDLKKYEVPSERTLQLDDIKTFKEW